MSDGLMFSNVTVCLLYFIEFTKLLTRLFTKRFKNFAHCCDAIPEMGEHIENGINVDPIPLSIEQFALAGNIDGKVSTAHLVRIL